jgi:large subunit ribosomal protein L4
VLDEIKLDAISTKRMAAFLDGLGATRKSLVVLDGVSEEIRMSSRNIPGVELRIAPAVSVRDILNADKIVMTRAAVAKLEEVFA